MKLQLKSTLQDTYIKKDTDSSKSEYYENFYFLYMKISIFFIISFLEEIDLFMLITKQLSVEPQLSTSKIFPTLAFQNYGSVQEKYFWWYLKNRKALSIQFLRENAELNEVSFGTLLISNRALLHLIFSTEGSSYSGSQQECCGSLQENFESNYLEPPSSRDLNFFKLSSEC